MIDNIDIENVIVRDCYACIHFDYMTFLERWREKKRRICPTIREPHGIK